MHEILLVDMVAAFLVTSRVPCHAVSKTRNGSQARVIVRMRCEPCCFVVVQS